MALIDKASLLMVPSVYEDGTLYNVLPSGNKAPDETGNNNGYDQTRADFTFSRGSNLAATRVNANGLIEKGRENLILQSDWDDVGTGTAPSGWTTYDPNFEAGEEPGQIRFNISGNRAYIFQNLSVSAGVYTFSVFVDSVTDASQNDDMIAVYGSVPKTFVCFSKDGEIIPINTPVEAGYRYSLTYNFTGSGTATFRVGAGVNGNDTADITLSRPQVEKGLVATDYIETGSVSGTAGVLENTPRIDYSSGAGSLKLEPQRTNLLPHSEYFGAWNPNNATLTANAYTSPEGYNNAYKFVTDGTNAGYIQSEGAVVVYNGVQHSFTMYFNTNSTMSGTMTMYVGWTGATGPNRSGVAFDVQTATFVSTYTSGSGAVIDYDITTPDSNGWYRVWFTANSTNTATGAELVVRDLNLIGDGSKYLLIYGAQMEASASYPSSYVPTYGSAATRGADSCSTIVSQLTGTGYTATLYIEFDGPLEPSATDLFKWQPSADVSTRFWIYTTAAGIAGGGAYAFNKNNAKHKFIFRVSDSTTRSIFYNGTKVVNTTGVAAGSGYDLINIADANALQSFNVSEIIGFNEALSDAECETLTTL